MLFFFLWMLEEMDLRSSNKLGPKLKRINALARSKELPSKKICRRKAMFLNQARGEVLAMVEIAPRLGNWGGLGDG
jgi:hypothetical protein